jgi:hypothetical protein
MIGLVIALWAIYVSECFVRWRPGDWVFRETASGVLASDAPDVTFVGGRFAFARMPLLPWSAAHVCHGEDLDGRGVCVRLEAADAEARWVKLSSAVLFGVLLIAVPALVVADRLLPVLYWSLGAVAVAWAATFGTFLTAYRRLVGAGPPIETWLVLLLSPVDLVRAPAVLSLRLIESAHPVAAADALCGDAEFLRVARVWQFDAPGLRQAIQQAAAARGLKDALAAPPPIPEPGVSRFCPRCSATFRDPATRCADCGCALELLNRTTSHRLQ